MSLSKTRRQIAWLSARLMVDSQELQFNQAKIQAGQQICRGRMKRRDLPSDAEIRDQIQTYARLLKLDLDQGTLDLQSQTDPYQVFEVLLLPLERVKQSPKHHPEGDVLYHSLQVFDLARDEVPYDEEFLLAALLHDVGKAIDPGDHIAAALEALAGLITPRTAWLIEHHIHAHRLRDGELGFRARRRLEASEDFETLMLLSDCDRAGRQRGVEVDDVTDTLEYLRSLSESPD